MSKQAMIEQLRRLGAVAAHLNNRWVTTVRGKPVRLVLVSPLFLDKNKLRAGDKIAIVDTQEGIAFLCRATAVQYAELSKAPILDLTVMRTMDLE